MSDIFEGLPREAMPLSVKRRMREIERNMKKAAEAAEAASATQPVNAPQVAQEPTAPPADVAATTAAPQPDVQAQGDAQGSQQPVEPAAAAAADAPVAAPVVRAEAPEAEVSRADIDALEHKYRTVAGMLRAKDEEVRRLQELVAQFTAANAQPQQPQSAPVEDASVARDREEFGDDLLAAIQRAVQRALQPLEQRLGSLEQMSRTTETVVRETRQERFERVLTDLMPTWRQLDADPNFGVWLQSSPARVDLLRQYMANFDAHAVAEIFNQYAVLNGKVAKKPTPGPSLEGKVAPARSMSSVPPTPPEKKIWTRLEIAEVYRNRRNYDTKSFSELEREIAQAQREGRVNYNV